MVLILFKYRFGAQPLAFVLNWSLTFQLCFYLGLNIVLVLNLWPLC